MIESQNKKIILVVEDDHELRQLYRRALVMEGFDVREANNGYTALVMLETHNPDLIVLDLGLPVVSGHYIQQEIAARSEARRIPVLVVTGSTDDLSRLDVECVLRKPIAPDELVDAARRCLRMSGNP